MILINFYLLTRLGGHNTASARTMKTSNTKQVFSSVRRKMGPTRCLSAACLVCNSNNANHGRIELDSHADKTVLGRNCVILTSTGKECEVSLYSDEYELIQHVKVVTGATAWNYPHSSEKFILVFNEALCMGEKLDHKLVNPNQILHHHIKVKENPHTQDKMGIT